MDFEKAISDNDIKIPLITIYYNPSDYPGKYVARLFDCSNPTHYIVLADTLENIRQSIPPTMRCFRRHPDDDPCIVEVWI